MRSFLVLLAVTVNAELSHKDKMNLVVVDTEGKLVYPAREMAKVSAEIDELEKMSHSLDMKLSQMEDLNLRDPEVWKKYTHTRDAARTATTTLEALRERMQGLDDQYVDAEKKLKAKVEPGLLLQLPGDSALLEEGEEADYEGEGPSKEEVEKEEAKNEQFKMKAENEEDAIEEKLVETPGMSDEEAADLVNEEKTWDADDEKPEPQVLLQEEEEALETLEKPTDEELGEEFEEESVKVDAAKSTGKWQQAMSLLETGYENALVAEDSEYQMSLFLADQGMSMDEIRKEFHLIQDFDEKKAEEEEALKAVLPEEALEGEAKAQEEKMQEQLKEARDMIQEEKADKNMKLLGLSPSLKIKSLESKEAKTGSNKTLSNRTLTGLTLSKDRSRMAALV